MLFHRKSRGWEMVIFQLLHLSVSAPIGENAFGYCSGFNGSLTIENGVVEIKKYAFYHCKGFTGSLKIPNSVTYIGVYAFYDCAGFTGDLIIGDGVTTIENGAFFGCKFKGTLKIGNSVTSIGNYAFSDCSGLEKITVDRGNKRYDSWGNCNSKIETGTKTLIVGCKNSVIQNSVTSIRDGAFRDYRSLTKLT